MASTKTVLIIPKCFFEFCIGCKYVRYNDTFRCCGYYSKDANQQWNYNSAPIGPKELRNCPTLKARLFNHGTKSHLLRRI